MEEILLLDNADIYRIILLILVVIGLGVAFGHMKSVDLEKSNSLTRLETKLFWGIAVAIIIAVVVFLLTFGFAGFHEIKFPFGYFSTNMGDWGDFATCVAGVFTFISVVLAFNAFKSQQLALRRNSFDSIFVQLFAHHVKLYEKISKNHEGKVFVYYYEKLKQRIDEGRINNKDDINELYISFIKDGYGDGKDCRVEYENLKNYFKYIYHEINLIRENEESGLLTREIAKKYVLLIQAQMNNYELLCYLLNQYNYYIIQEKKGKVNRIH